ncbi:MAG TPA: VWA domain-containing protein [Kofleriaceae bacterium]|nr:VWA domain-containing protein [Kofleriaceae bacterium]
MKVTFVMPELFWLACASPLYVLGLHLYDRARRRRLTSRLGELPVLGRVMASASPGRRLGKDVLIALAFALILVSAARPQIAGKRRVELQGLDVVIAMDVSKSMLVDDVGPTARMTERKLDTTRLARARELAGAVIDELPGDRIGPVVFAGAATHFPVTEDHQVARLFLNDLGPNDLPFGSNLAEVFRVSRCLLRPDLYEDLGCERIGRRGTGGDPLRGESLDPEDKKKDKDKGAEEDEEVIEQQVERGKAIVIFTDGGEADEATVREVKTARELGIAVFLVGLGTAEGGLVPEVDSLTGRRTGATKTTPDGQPVRSRRDDAGMKAIAAAGGDERRYIVADETGEVKPLPIVEALRGVERGLATKQVKDLRDIFQPFLFGAFMLLVIEVAIGTRRRREYPEAS